MQKRINIFILTLLILITSNSRAAHAAILWDWIFLNSGITVGATDNVHQLARIVNNSTAGETIGFFPNTGDARIIMASAVGEPGYNQTFGPSVSGDYFNQFLGFLIEPGESFDFTFAVYDPINNADIGFHVVDPQQLQIITMDGNDTRFTLTNPFEWCVETCEANPTIPEPMSVILFGFGASALGMTRRKFQK